MLSGTPARGSSALPHPVADPVPLAPPEVPERRVTRLQQGIRKPKIYSDDTIRYDNLATTSDLTAEPSTLHDALINKNWKLAMDNEYEALMRNKTWHLVLPSKGKNIIDCKWVYKVH